MLSVDKSIGRMQFTPDVRPPRLKTRNFLALHIDAGRVPLKQLFVAPRIVIFGNKNTVVGRGPLKLLKLTSTTDKEAS